jgi:hypothetical protein
MRHTCAFFSLALAASACAVHQADAPSVLPANVSGRSLASNETQGMPASGRAAMADQVLTAEAAPASKSFFSFSSSSSSAGPISPLPGGTTTQQVGEMIDIEARFAIQCDSVAVCADHFRTQVLDLGGRITSDESDAGQKTEVTFEVRVPTERFEGFAGSLAKIGPISARDIKRRDVSKEYHDSELLLREREAEFARYEELLKQAKDVPETLQVEQQLSRLRTEIDRIKGDLVWLKDRVAMATVRVRIYPSSTSDDAVFAPTATFYPTVRSSLLFDLRSETQRSGYFGAGFSIQFKQILRDLAFDIDIARAVVADKPTSSDWSYTFLTGFDLYSELLGGGRRKFINPFIGFRFGYAITNGSGDFAFGGTVGVDIVKTKAVLLDLHARVLGLVGNDQGPHVMLGPALDFSFAF